MRMTYEKFVPDKLWTAVLYDADQKYPYLKRFTFEAGSSHKNCLGENPKSTLYLLTDEYYPRIEVIFGGHDAFREPMIVEAESFVVPRSYKAKGKRLTVYQISAVNELEPDHYPEAIEKEETSKTEAVFSPEGDEEIESMEDLKDEIVGQMKLFKD